MIEMFLFTCYIFAVKASKALCSLLLRDSCVEHRRRTNFQDQAPTCIK